MVDLVYDCAKFKYECGNYSEAAEYLYFYRVVVSMCVCMCVCVRVRVRVRASVRASVRVCVCEVHLFGHRVTMYSTYRYKPPSSPYPYPSPTPQAPPDHPHLMTAMWGKLSCAILMQEWDTALEDLTKLRREIDETVGLLKDLYCVHMHVCMSSRGSQCYSTYV